MAELARTVLGRTGLKVSRIGFGGIPIQRLDFPAAEKLVRAAFDRGINFFDTAHGYTDSEKKIGRALQGVRDRAVIATKSAAGDAAGLAANLDRSLKQLGTDYVDLFQLHGVNNAEKAARVAGPGGALEALLRAREQGKVRHLGFSSHVLDGARILADNPHMETVQFPYSFVGREPAEELLPLARARGLGFIAMKPFGGGVFGEARLCLKYLLAQPGVVPIPGLEKIAELDEDLAAAAEPPGLTAAEEARLEKKRRELGPRFCRKCDYCQPCAAEIKISLAIHSRSLFGRFAAADSRSGWIKATMEKVSECQDCGECEKRCPFSLPVREMLKESLVEYQQYMAAIGPGGGGRPETEGRGKRKSGKRGK